MPQFYQFCLSTYSLFNCRVNKCNLRRIADYPNLWNYLKDLYQQPGVKETCNLDHIKRHYYKSHTNINPTRIVPKGPLLDFDARHDRDRFQNLVASTPG